LVSYTAHSNAKTIRYLSFFKKPKLQTGFFLRFRFGDRKEILRDRLEEFERPFSIDVISGHYILRERWRNLRDRFGPSKHLKKNTGYKYHAVRLPHLSCHACNISCCAV